MTQLILEVTTGEEALDDDDDEENDTFTSHVALDGVTIFEAAELDAIALLADTWDNGLDPEVSAQLAQASGASLPFIRKGGGKGKGNGKSKGRYPVRPSHFFTGRLSTTTERTESEN